MGLNGAGFQIVGLPGRKEEIVCAIVWLPIVYSDLPTDYKKGIAMHYDCRILVQTNTKQFRVRVNNEIEITFASACVDVLVNRGIGEQSESGYMTWRYHNRAVVTGNAANKKRPLD